MCNCNFSNADGFVDNEFPSTSNGLLDLPFDGRYSNMSHMKNMTGANLDFGSPYGDFEDDVEEVIGEMSHSNRFTGEAEFGDGEFDDFLTRRSRERRKLRKKLRKAGKSKKEARKEAVKMIPKQKLGTLIKTVATKGLAPSEETSKLLSDLDAKGVIDKKDNPNNIVNQITEAVNENIAEGTQNEGTGADMSTTAPMGDMPVKQAGVFGGKRGMLIGVGVLVLVGGFFLLRKKK